MLTTLIRETRDGGTLTRILVAYDRRDRELQLTLEFNGEGVGSLCFDHQDALWLQSALAEAMFAQNTSLLDESHLVPLEPPPRSKGEA